MSRSHPCFTFFLVTSRSSLVCLPRGNLPLKQPFKLTSLVVVHHDSHHLLFAPSVVLPGAVLSRMSSLRIFTWAELFHSCHSLLRLTIPFTHALCWSSLFSLLVAMLGSSSSRLPQHWLFRAPSIYVAPHCPLLHCQLHLSLQTFPCKLMQFWNKLVQAHLPNTVMARWCWAAAGCEQLLLKHCGVFCHDKISQREWLFLTRQAWAASSLVLLSHTVQMTDGAYWQLLHALFCPYLSDPMDRNKIDYKVWLKLHLLCAVQPRPRSLQVL